MTRICWWLADLLSRTLEPDERDAVRGDLTESGETGAQALRGVLGLVVRRQAAPFKSWQPWVALLALVVPFAVLLSLVSRRTADGSAIYIWMYANNSDWAMFGMAGFRHDLAHYALAVFMEYVTLACWSWTIGFVLGSVSRRTVQFNAVLFCLVVLFSEIAGMSRYLGHSLLLSRGRDFHANDAAFELTFYRVMLPLIVQTLLVLLPSLWGMRRAQRVTRLRSIFGGAAIATLAAIALQTYLWWRYLHPRLPMWAGQPISLLQLVVYWPLVYLIVSAVGRRRLAHASALLLAVAGIAGAADQAAVRAALQTPAERKPATEFSLKDSSGKTVTLKKYRGKVVLLDFWATWCHGCKEEIPWFVEFQQKYGAKGLAVVGVSLDEDGWKVVRPFIKTANVPYRILLGDEATAKKYGIENMPDTYLIDRQGRIAATYVGLVDKDDVEANIRAILGQK